MQHHVLSPFFPDLNKKVMVTMPYNSERPMMSNARDDAAERRKYFTKFTPGKAIFYCCVAVYWALFSFICVAEMFLPDSLICDTASIPAKELAKAQMKYNNPSFVYDPCEQMMLPYLLFLSRLQCNLGRRLLASGLLGGIVGWERREADRPAGIRTMALVSLGVCLFTINSMYTFLNGPMGWDSSRVAATIPSGVGFLGAGLIFKDAHKDDSSGASTFHRPLPVRQFSQSKPCFSLVSSFFVSASHVVHGLTTAASLWIVRFLKKLTSLTPTYVFLTFYLSLFTTYGV
jgi:MgtC family